MVSAEMREAVAEALSFMEMTMTIPSGAPAMSGDLIQVWATVLERAGLTADEVRGAAQRIVTTRKFFPAVAEFLEAARPPVDEDALAEKGWINVRRFLADYGSYASAVASDFENDPAALWAVGQMGLEELGETDDKTRPFRRQDFVRLYKLARANGYGLQHLAGRFERENRSRGLSLAGPACGRPDWLTLPPVVAAPALPEADGETLAMVRIDLPELAEMK